MLEDLKKTIKDILTYILKVERKTLLWTNPDGSGDPQTIPLNLSGYDYIEVWFYDSMDADAMVPNTVNIKIGGHARVVLVHSIGNDGTNENTGSRMITANTNNVVIGKYAYKNRRTGGTLTTANAFCAPYKIYGVKRGGVLRSRISQTLFCHRKVVGAC